MAPHPRGHGRAGAAHVGADEDCRPVAVVLEVGFTDQDAVDRRMASSIRPATEAAVELFDGRVFHPVAEATALTPAAG